MLPNTKTTGKRMQRNSRHIDKKAERIFLFVRTLIHSKRGLRKIEKIIDVIMTNRKGLSTKKDR